MSLKKKIKKSISFFVPKGYTKEKIKLFFYKTFSKNNVSFDVLKVANTHTQGSYVYKTTFDDITLLTNQALYPIVDDFGYYNYKYKAKSGDIIIDAGANLGHISIFFSKCVGKSGKVFCFEPDKHNVKQLESNIKLNKDLEDNIILQDMLLWNEDTLIDFEEAGTVGSSAKWFSGNANVVKKQAITIDSWVKQNNINRLDLIKMDIEGAEIEAVEGCLETMKTLKPNFAIASYHIINGEPTYLKLEEFFKKNNYPYKTVTFRGNEIITFAGNI